MEHNIKSINPETWLNDHGDALYRYALLQVHNETEAEDLVQETFLAALKAQHTFSQTATLRTWLIGILKHKIIDFLRKKWRESSLEDHDIINEDSLDDFFTLNGDWISPPTAWGDPENSLKQEQFWQVLQQCMGRLPPKLAYLFALKEFDETPNEKICNEVELTPTNLRVMLFRARLQLRQCFEINWSEKKERH